MDLQSYYDEHAEYVARRDPTSLEAEQVLLEVRTYKIPGLVSVLPAGFSYATVAEIGCATGELIGSFSEAVAGGTTLALFGFDVSRSNIVTARDRFPSVFFTNDDYLSHGPFDLVILSDVLEHVPDDLQFLERASRAGRILLINFPLEDNWINRNRQYGFNDPSGHLRFYTEASARDLVVRAGLKVIKSRRVWSHESSYDIKRRVLRKNRLGHSHSGSGPARAIKIGLHFLARHFRPLGRRLYPSNLFLSATRGKGGR